MSQSVRQTDLDWIQLGHRDPYFGVLSNEKDKIENAEAGMASN